MRKPRSDSKLDRLPEEQKAQLADWLLSGMPYHLVKDLVKKTFGVSTSIRALAVFYQDYCAAELLARRKRAVSTADEIAEEASRQPGRFDAATIDALKQKAFELAIAPGADPRAVKAVFSLVLKARDQDLEAQQIELDYEKFRSSVKSSVERGLDALFEEIKNNPAAVELFKKLRAIVMQKVDEAS